MSALDDLTDEKNWNEHDGQGLLFQFDVPKARAELEALRAENERFTRLADCVPDLKFAHEFEKIKAENAKLRELLKESEWLPHYDGLDYCWCCGTTEELDITTVEYIKKHKDNCALAKALETKDGDK